MEVAVIPYLLPACGLPAAFARIDAGPADLPFGCRLLPEGGVVQVRE